MSGSALRVGGELRALRLVDDGDERLERRLVVEEIVLVDLVRSDDDFDVPVEIHPGHVAVAIVVATEARRRACVRKRFSDASS